MKKKLTTQGKPPANQNTKITLVDVQHPSKNMEKISTGAATKVSSTHQQGLADMQYFEGYDLTPVTGLDMLYRLSLSHRGVVVHRRGGLGGSSRITATAVLLFDNL